MQPRNISLLVGAGLIILIGGLYWGTQDKAPTPSEGKTIDLSKVSTTTTTTLDGYTITPVAITEIARPDYKNPIVYSATVSVEARAAIAQQFADVKVLLGKDQMDFDAWMRLATLHKIAGNFKGAEAIWIYCSKQWVNYVPHANLGDLYLNFTHEYAKAEAQYKAALALSPLSPADMQAGVDAAKAAQKK